LSFRNCLIFIRKQGYKSVNGTTLTPDEGQEEQNAMHLIFEL